MFCENCGAKNAKTNAFCEKCGERLAHVEESTKVEKEKKVQKIEEPIVKVSRSESIELLFEKQKYASYIGKVQHSITMCYVYWIGIGLLFSGLILATLENVHSGPFTSGNSEGMQIFAIFPPIIGLIIAHSRTLEKKIRVQEMRWRLDFYTKYVK